MTIATLLSRMAILDNELAVGVAGADESRAITALDMAQDYFESVAATLTPLFGRTGTFTTTANTEETTWPSTLLRLDALWRLNSNSKPVAKLEPIDEAGEQALGAPWPISLAVATAVSGAPREYFTNRTSFFWRPTPDAIYTLRWYGMASADDITARAETFAYPDMIATPVASFATRLLKTGLGDPTEELQALAVETFTPALKALARYDRTRPTGRFYTRVHRT